MVNGVQQSFAGAPTLTAGQDYFLFLWTSKTGLTQVIGLSQGLFTVTTNSSGPVDRLARRDERDDAQFLRPGHDRFQHSDAAGANARPDSDRAGWRPRAMRKRWVLRLAALVAGSFLLANTGSAYYYYTYFNSSVGALYADRRAVRSEHADQQYGSFLRFRSGPVDDVSGRFASRPSSARSAPPPTSGTASAHPAYGWPLGACTAREQRNRRPEFRSNSPMTFRPVCWR